MPVLPVAVVGVVVVAVDVVVDVVVVDGGVRAHVDLAVVETNASVAARVDLQYRCSAKTVERHMIFRCPSFQKQLHPDGKGP